jgi:hypothetical protein
MFTVHTTALFTRHVYFTVGGCQDGADAEWIVIWLRSSGHNDTPFGQPTSCRPIGCQGTGHPQGIFGVLVTIN